jgi:hypothetical protein
MRSRIDAEADRADGRTEGRGRSGAKRDNDPFLQFSEMFGTPPTVPSHIPRSKRIVVPGLPYHITQRGNGKAKVFDCDQDRSVFLDLLANYSQQFGLSL